MANQGTGTQLLRAVRRVPQWVGELLLVAAIYLIYEFARGLHQGTQARANTTALDLLRWEHAVRLDPEKWLSVHVDKLTWLAVPASYMYATMHYIVTPAVLIWLYLKHRSVYGPARTWLAISTLMSLVIFYLVPTTPPRLLHHGYPDVLSDVQQYGWWGNAGSAPKGLGHLTNQLAAMPSMHLGWALWCGFMLYRYSTHTVLRVLGVAYPLLTSVVVLSTGNHYLFDLVGGAVVMGVGASASLAWTRGRRRMRARRRAAAAPALGTHERITVTETQAGPSGAAEAESLRSACR